MCFAPEVDLVAATVVAVAGIDAWCHNESPRTAPLAALPTLFAGHTLASAFVWWGLDGTVPPSVADAATTYFMVFAFVVLPIYVPLAILLIEQDPWRRLALLGLAAAGTVSAVDSAAALAQGRGAAEACGPAINYTIAGSAYYSGMLYILATCGALLLSSRPVLVAWGVLNGIVVVALGQWAQAGLPSLWCFWAAITSFFVAWCLRRDQRAGQEAQPVCRLPAAVRTGSG